MDVLRADIKRKLVRLSQHVPRHVSAMRSYVKFSKNYWKISRTRRKLLLLILAGVTFVYVVYCVGIGNFLEPSRDAADDLHSFWRFDRERGGAPVQVILVSNWRSGSSFVAKLIASVPNSFYYFEPVNYLPDPKVRIEGPPRSDEAISFLNALLKCNHSKLAVNGTIVEKNSLFLPVFNLSADICGKDMQFCRQTEFTQILCRGSPFHVIKLVRVHLSFIESLLKDQSLHVIVLYLVRDPRGTLYSRRNVDFMEKYETMPVTLCTNLVTEFDTAKRLHENFPDRFKVWRYEDLVENPTSAAKEIFDFLGYEMHPRVLQFIEKHTHVQKAGALSLERNSSYTAFRWTKELPFDSIDEIQNTEPCPNAMRLWGYKTLTKVSIQQNAVPYRKRSEYDFERFIETI